MEIWKDIKGYEGSYMVSNYGRVKSLEKNIKSHNCSRIQYRPERILKQYKSKWGYMRVYLTQNSIKKMFAVHRLVAMAFIDNPDNKPCVNHIDNNRNNNVVDNLEWCTYKENNVHASDTGLIRIAQKVMIVETGEVFNSLGSCAREIGGNAGDISRCLHSRGTKTHKGYHFERVV